MRNYIFFLSYLLGFLSALLATFHFPLIGGKTTFDCCLAPHLLVFPRLPVACAWPAGVCEWTFPWQWPQRAGPAAALCPAGAPRSSSCHISPLQALGDRAGEEADGVKHKVTQRCKSMFCYLLHQSSVTFLTLSCKKTPHIQVYIQIPILRLVEVSDSKSIILEFFFPNPKKGKKCHL